MTFQLVGLVWFMVFNATYKLNFNEIMVRSALYETNTLSWMF